MAVAGLLVLSHMPTPPANSPLHIAWGRRNIHSTPSTAKAFSSLSVHPHAEPLFVHPHAGAEVLLISHAEMVQVPHVYRLGDSSLTDHPHTKSHSLSPSYAPDFCVGFPHTERCYVFPHAPVRVLLWFCACSELEERPQGHDFCCLCE